MRSIKQPSATGGGLGGFETRLLAELQQVVAERAAVAGPQASRRAGWRRAGWGWPHPVVTGAFSAALAAGLAAGLIVTSTGGGPGPAAIHFAPATTAVAVLDNAAAAALHKPVIKPSPGQFVYTRVKLQVNLPVTKQTVETWTSASGTRVGATVTFGPTTRTIWDLVSACVNGIVKPGLIPAGQHCTPRQFAAYRPWLPTTTAGMLAYLKRSSPRDGSIAQSLLENGFYLLMDVDLTPAQQAATYHALAEVPGLTVVPKMTDILGRAGVGIRSHFGGTGTWSVIFSRTTFQLLGLDVEAVGPRYDREAMAVQPTIVGNPRQRP